MPDTQQENVPASAFTYSFRRSIASGMENFTLTESALGCFAGSLPLSDIAVVRLYSLPGMRMAFLKVTGEVRRCILRFRTGQTIELVSQNFVSLGKFEDRSAAFDQFVSALVTQVSRSNPSAQLVTGMPPRLWWIWFITFGGLTAALVLSILFGAIGLIAEGDLNLATAAFLLVLGVMLIGPATFLRVVWRGRTRPLHPWKS
jgi:hypothetical protein